MGLFDMHGNVFEWMAGGNRSYSSDAVTDPTDSITSSYMGQRGGSWGLWASTCVQPGVFS